MHYLLYGRSVAHTEVWAPATLFEGLLSLAEETYRRLYSRKLSREKTSRELVGNKIFVKKTFAYCSLVPPKDTTSVFSRDVVLGGKLFLWGEKNVKNIQKTNEICYCLGGKFKT